jgi:hypothetical protein
MKTLSRINAAKGTTLVEIAVAAGVLGLLGLVFFQVLNSGLILYAKNMAVNTAHEEAREGVNRLTRDIHASISVPQLRDANFNVVSSTPVGGVAPTAAGVSFQNIASGPNYVWKDPVNIGMIMIKTGTPAPTAGMRLIVPFWGLEEDITKVEAGGATNHKNIFIKADQSTPQIDPPDYGNPYAITYYTYRTMYLVKNGQYIADPQGPWILSGGSYIAFPTGGTMQRYRYENGELHLYRQDYNGSAVYWKDAATVARYISSPQPFYIPLNSGGSPNTKYVGVKLSARDPKSSNRGYLASASLLDTQVDYRSRICLSQ